MEIMVTGRKFSFEEARDMSLVHDIYDSISLDEFRMDVLDYAGQFTLPLAAAKAISFPSWPPPRIPNIFSLFGITG